MRCSIGRPKRTAHLAWEPGQLPKDDFLPLLQRARVLRERLAEIIQETSTADTSEEGQLEKLLGVNDKVVSAIEQSKGFKPPPSLLLPSQIVNQQSSSSSPSQPVRNGGHGGTKHFMSPRHMRVPSLEISSPNFSIGDSDNDSDAEELDVGNISHSSMTVITPPQRSIPLEQDSSSEPIPDSGEVSQGADERMGLGLGSLGLEPGPEPEVDASPVEKASKAWVEEEAEIFRKGTRLGVVDDVDEEEREVSGEELRKEVSH